jgi:hypothetical protein
MADLGISEYSNYDEFVRERHADDLGGVALDDARDRGLLNEDDTRLLWQLLGQLSEDEVLIEIPDWLAEEKVGYSDGATPTTFVGQIERETEKAIHLMDSASARPLMKLAHRIQHLEDGDTDEDRREWLDNRLHELREEFEQREDVTGVSEEWIPKSQLLHAIRRSD